jgi:hypothetical protein
MKITDDNPKDNNEDSNDTDHKHWTMRIEKEERLDHLA